MSLKLILQQHMCLNPWSTANHTYSVTLVTPYPHWALSETHVSEQHEKQVLWI